MGLFNSIGNLFKKKEATTQTEPTLTSSNTYVPPKTVPYVSPYTPHYSATPDNYTPPQTVPATYNRGSNALVSTQDPGGFSGKVEELGPGGETVSTSYYYGNQEVGRLSGGEYTPTNYNSSANYSLGFNQGANQEKVSLSSKELTIQQSTLSYSQAQPLNQDYGFNEYKGENNPSGLTSEKGKTSLGFDKYTITSGAPVVQEFGVPIVTQEEATRYGINSNNSAVWVLSTTDKDKAMQEFSYASTIPYTTRPFNTKDLVISNIANIKAGQEIYRLGSTGAQVDTQAIYSQAVIDTRTQYKSRPLGQRVLLYGAGIVQGTAAIGIKTTEFMQSTTMTLGYGTPTTFKFGGTLGQLSNYPIARSTTFLNNPVSYVKESLSSPNVVANIAAVSVGTASVVSRARKVGTYEALAETASYFSPIRIKPGVYAADISNTKFTNIKSVKYTNEAGVSTRAFYGNSGPTKIYGSEKFIQTGDNVVGGGTVITTTPFTEIRAGGAIVKTGVRSTYQPYTFDNLRVGSANAVKTGDLFTVSIPSIPGATTRVLTSKGITSYDYYEGGSVIYEDLYKGFSSTSGGATSPTKEIAVNSFASGKANAYYKTDIYSQTFSFKTNEISTDFIYAPTGKYKVSPQLVGKEFNLNALGGAQDKGYTSFGGGGSQASKTLLSSTFATPTLSAQRLQATTTTTSSPLVPSFTKTSQGPTLKVNQIQSPVLTSSNILAPLVITSTAEQTSSNSRSKSITVPTFSSSFFTSPAVDTAFKTNIVQGSKLNFLTAQTQSYKSSFIIPSIVTSSFYFNPGPTRPGVDFIPMLNFGGGSDLSSNLLQGGKRVTGYTPSFTALVFNLKGTYAGGGAISKSGIDFRPITPGFKFNTGLGNGFTKLRKFFKR